MGMMGTETQDLASAPTSKDAPGSIGVRQRAFMPDVLAEAPRWASVGYGLVAAFVAVYVITVVARDGTAGNVMWDGWDVAIVELCAAFLCLARLGVSKPALRGRGVVLALGAGMISWAVGDVIVASRFTSPTPAAALLCYLGFYPLAYVAIVLLMRQEVTRLPRAAWLDGALAGLGAAAVCAAFAFKDLLSSTGGSSFMTAMNLAYPIGDVLLLALVVGGSAMLPGRRRARWFLVATACALNAVGDTFNLLHNTFGASPVGRGFNATAWPVAIVLMSIAMWTRSAPRAVRDQSATSGFILPGLSAAAGLVILIVGSVHSVGRVAFGLAAATLVVAGLRLAMSVNELKSVTEQRHRQSITDELTGLGNRRHLSQLFDSLTVTTADEAEPMAVAAAAVLTAGDAPSTLSAAGPKTPVTQSSVALLFVDLDRFKEVNDSFGHSVGDELLRQIGPRLESTLRKGDTLVRLGGDEFAVVLPSTDEEQAFRVAERLVASLEQPFYLDLVPVQISASIGIALAPRDGSDLNEILRSADAAMYSAKMSGVQVQIYDRAFDREGDLLHLAEELSKAVDSGGLVLHYQPLLDLKSGTISSVEALLRWEHPRLGMIPPLKFLPLAEESGLMPAITARVLNDALEQCAIWRAEGLDLAVSVNVSASNLLDSGFVDIVSSAVERSGVPPEALVLEITETCIISDYQRSRDVIDQLQRLGVVMSIDDFGAGFTSLAHLSNLAVGELKLDRSFIAPLADGDDKRDVELVRATIGLGHALGLRVVAEGIETEEALELLSQFGCDVAQGYLISRPAPPDRLELAVLTSTWREKAFGKGALAAVGVGPQRPIASTSA
jgi:diguanylate cyclase